MNKLTRLSKFVSLILRHRAKDFGVQLDAEGFTDFAGLQRIVAEKSSDPYSEDDWLFILRGDTDGKKRFELKDGRIRALYGHSRVDAVTYPPVEPPEVLYHGTTPQAEKNIRKTGLQPMKRQYVHLSANTERALSVGGRRTEQVSLLIVRAQDAHRAGIEFYNPEPLHFLAKSIPPQFIDFPNEAK
jgi:putative RNA 2'-phosphotransferase